MRRLISAEIFYRLPPDVLVRFSFSDKDPFYLNCHPYLVLEGPPILWPPFLAIEWVPNFEPWHELKPLRRSQMQCVTMQGGPSLSRLGYTAKTCLDVSLV